MTLNKSDLYSSLASGSSVVALRNASMTLWNAIFQTCCSTFSVWQKRKSLANMVRKLFWKNFLCDVNNKDTVRNQRQHKNNNYYLSTYRPPPPSLQDEKIMRPQMLRKTCSFECDWTAGGDLDRQAATTVPCRNGPRPLANVDDSCCSGNWWG